MKVLSSVVLTLAILSAPMTAAAQNLNPIQDNADQRPQRLRFEKVQVSGVPYIDLAVNYGAVPAFINQRGESYLVFTPVDFTSLDALRKDLAERNATVQFGDTVTLETVRQIENFSQQLYAPDPLLAGAIKNSVILARAGNVTRQQNDLSRFGQPSDLSTIGRYRFMQDQIHDPLRGWRSRI